jgi:hypothetical protein
MPWGYQWCPVWAIGASGAADATRISRRTRTPGSGAYRFWVPMGSMLIGMGRRARRAALALRHSDREPAATDCERNGPTQVEATAKAARKGLGVPVV